MFAGSSLLSAEDIVQAVQRLHQAMTHLAAKYQTVHSAVTELKCEYQVQSRRISAPPAALAGPSPFTAPADPLTRARMSISGGPVSAIETVTIPQSLSTCSLDKIQGNTLLSTLSSHLSYFVQSKL